MLAPRYLNLISYICVGHGISTIGNTKVRDIWKYDLGLKWFSMILQRNFQFDSLYYPKNATKGMYNVHRVGNGDSFLHEK